MPKKTTPTPKKPSEGLDLSFEEASNELENLVAKVESERSDLETLVENFDRGMALYDHCNRLLEDATERITIIRERRNHDQTASNNVETSLDKSGDSDDFTENGELF